MNQHPMDDPVTHGLAPMDDPMTERPAIRLQVQVEYERDEPLLWGYITAPCNHEAIRAAAREGAIPLLREHYAGYPRGEYHATATVIVPEETPIETLREWLAGQDPADFEDVVVFRRNLKGAVYHAYRHGWSWISVVYDHQPRATFFSFAIADSMFPYSAECTIRRRELDVDTVREIVGDGVIPCLNPSHQATIDAMRTRFGIDVSIPETPPRVELHDGDKIIVLGVRGLPRLTDRHEYTAEEIEGAEFRFSEYRIYNVVKACPPGWQTFRFRSMWDGSVGDGQDLDVLFYFRPGLDIGGWEIIDTHSGFIHRFRGGNEAYESFTSWLESLQEGVDFINAEDILV